MKKVKKEDVAATIIERIMSSAVPAEGQLQNPLNAEKKSRKGGQMSMNDVAAPAQTGLPDDVGLWTTRSFVDYFAKKWQTETGGNYKKTYVSDQAVFNEIGKFMASNGLERNEWTKKFIDWCFKRRAEIVKKSGHFMPSTIRQYLNQFYQDTVMPMVETDKVARVHVEVPILDEIKIADEEGRANEIFLRFGIPIAATFFICHKGLKASVIEKGLDAMVEKLASGPAADRERLEGMFHKSVLRSPYPVWFEFLDWRDRYAKYTKPYVDANWWREDDYRGRPLPEYDKLQHPEG